MEESRRLHGDNLITPRKGDSAWKLFAEKFRDPIIQVLLVAALLSLAMAFIDGEFLETIGIICAIVLATCVGFFFELDAMRRFKRLNLVNDDKVSGQGRPRRGDDRGAPTRCGRGRPGVCREWRNGPGGR